MSEYFVLKVQHYCEEIFQVMAFIQRLLPSDTRTISIMADAEDDDDQ